MMEIHRFQASRSRINRKKLQSIQLRINQSQKFFLSWTTISVIQNDLDPALLFNFSIFTDNSIITMKIDLFSHAVAASDLSQLELQSKSLKESLTTVVDSTKDMKIFDTAARKYLKTAKAVKETLTTAGEDIEAVTKAVEEFEKSSEDCDKIFDEIEGLFN